MIQLKVKHYFLSGLVSAFLGLMFSFQAVASDITDEREIIWVSAQEKSMLLSDMRAFLVASQKVLEANLAGDMKAVEEAARLVGLKLFKEMPEDMNEKLPISFTMIGPRAYMGFEAIVYEATGSADREAIFSQLAQLQKNCIACHALFRFEVKE